MSTAEMFMCRSFHHISSAALEEEVWALSKQPIHMLSNYLVVEAFQNVVAAYTHIKSLSQRCH